MADANLFLSVSAVRNTNPLINRVSQQNVLEEFPLQDLSTRFRNITECSVDNSTVTTEEGGVNRCSSCRETNYLKELRKSQDQLSRVSAIVGEKDESIEQHEEAYIKLHREKTQLEVKDKEKDVELARCREENEKLKEKDVELARCREALRIEKSKNKEAQLRARTMEQENVQLKKDYNELNKEKARLERKHREKDVELARCREGIEKLKNKGAQLRARAMEQENVQLKKDYNELNKEKARLERKHRDKDVELARFREELKIEKSKKWEAEMRARGIEQVNEQLMKDYNKLKEKAIRSERAGGQTANATSLLGQSDGCYWGER